jgi:hypothetical protein
MIGDGIMPLINGPLILEDKDDLNKVFFLQ